MISGSDKYANLEDFDAIAGKAKRLESLIKLSNNLRERERRFPITFNDFLYNASRNPEVVFRDIFQLFYDMLHHYVPDGEDDYSVTDQSIGFVQYDFSKLFVEDSDNPFFADRLFANRIMNLAEGLKKGGHRNSILLFEGPPGSGKSTFLNQLLQKLEDYAKTDAGTTYKVFWKITLKALEKYRKFRGGNAKSGNGEEYLNDSVTDSLNGSCHLPSGNLEFSCPNHDHPILMIPKSYRKEFLDELIPDEKFKERLFNEKQYEWVIKGVPCNICNALYKALLDTTGDPLAVYSMLNARKNFFSRQLGEGISVFNPGDQVIKKPITNITLQRALNNLFSSDEIRFYYSYLAKTNNGMLALMDIKENNVFRLKEYHGIISDGVHKVELAEEYINTLFIGLVNPADKKEYEDIPSFQDRIETVKIPYILDYKTEISVYRNKFGSKIESHFMPRVLENFAKIIISTRLDIDSPTIKSWIANPESYSKYTDKDMLLLKMDLYAGKVPIWLSDKDIKGFNRNIRKRLVEESEFQGRNGISGRQCLTVLNRLLNLYTDSEKLITMDMLKEFFGQEAKNLNVEIPSGFIDSLINSYDYEVLQEVKEAIYYYNEKQLSDEILDYLFAINYEPGTTKQCNYTAHTIEVTEEFFDDFESMLLGGSSTISDRKSFRKDMHSEYITSTISQEIQLEGKAITETEQYKKLFERYTRNLKEHSLTPYAESENFRRAILDYGTSNFNAYDKRIRRDVELLLTNLVKKFSYSPEGARQISLYVLDKGLIKKYS